MFIDFIQTFQIDAWYRQAKLELQQSGVVSSGKYSKFPLLSILHIRNAGNGIKWRKKCLVGCAMPNCSWQ